jgi:hypothetical protein
MIPAFTAVPNRRQQLRIYARQPRQLARVQAVILARALRNQPHSVCVGYDHFVIPAVLVEPAADASPAPVPLGIAASQLFRRGGTAGARPTGANDVTGQWSGEGLRHLYQADWCGRIMPPMLRRLSAAQILALAFWNSFSSERPAPAASQSVFSLRTNFRSRILAPQWKYSRLSVSEVMRNKPSRF